MNFISINQSVFNTTIGCYEEHFALLTEGESHSVSLTINDEHHLTMQNFDFNIKTDALCSDCFKKLLEYFKNKENVVPNQKINKNSLGLIRVGCLSMAKADFDYEWQPRESQWIKFVTKNATSYYDISDEPEINDYLAYIFYDSPSGMSISLGHHSLDRSEITQRIKQDLYGFAQNTSDDQEDPHYNDDIDLNDFEIKENVLVKYLGKKSVVKIPTCVCKIGKWAFLSNDSIYAVIIPNSVTELDEGAFCRCHNLTHVVLSDYIGAIPLDAFYYCNRIESLIIPSSVKSIKYRAFSRSFKVIAEKKSYAITFAKRDRNVYEALDGVELRACKQQLINYINKLEVESGTI